MIGYGILGTKAPYLGLRLQNEQNYTYSHASGTGTLNITAPNTNSTRTLTLPDADLNLGNVLTTSSSVDAANLTGALPAISGAALTNLPAGGGMTYLGAVTTTSGTSVTFSGMTLTSYKLLQFVLDGVSEAGGDGQLYLNSQSVAVLYQEAATDYASGSGFIELTSGLFWCSSACQRTSGAIGVFNRAGASGLTASSTSITFTISATAFDAGAIRFYGVA